MTVEIEVGGERATIKDYRWKCKDDLLRKLLQGMLDPGGPSPSQPHPDYEAAVEAVRALGGKVLTTEPEPGPADGVVY